MNSDGVVQFEYKIDDGLWLPVETDFRADVYQGGGPIALHCPAFNAFSGGADFTSFPGNTSHTFYLRGVTAENGLFDIAEITVNLGDVSAAPPEVERLSLKSLPYITEYEVGDSLNTDGLIVIAGYEDGAEEAIFSGYTCEYDFSEAGTKTVTVAFGGKTAFFEVSVKEAFISGDVNGDGVINGRDSGRFCSILRNGMLKSWKKRQTRTATASSTGGTPVCFCSILPIGTSFWDKLFAA